MMKLKFYIEKILKLIEASELQIEGFMDEIARVKQRIYEVSEKNESQVEVLDNEQMNLYNKINAFSIEYDHQSLNERERVEEQKEEINRLQEELMKANREHDEAQKAIN